MEIDLLWLGAGIAVAGYYLGDGLKNFKSLDDENIIDDLDFNDGRELIKDIELHEFIGISKEDVLQLIKEHPGIPEVSINGKIFHSKEKIRKWLSELDENF